MAISPSGVEVAATLETVFAQKTGIGSFSTAQRIPMRIPQMMGFVTTPLKVFFSFAPFSAPPSGFIRLRISTAATL